MFRSARHEVGNDTDAEARDHDVIVERRVVRPWAIVALVVGIAAIAFGVWGLVRTGLNSDHIFTPTKDVLGVHQTPALALGEIAFGLLLLIAASMPAVGRVLMALLGAASLAFGVVVLADGWSHRIDRWTAANDTTGWMFVVVGAVTFLSALLPTMRSEREVAAEQPVTAAESGADATDAERRADRTPASHERGRHWWQPVHGHRAGA